MAVRAGQLRHRITLKRPATQTANAYGETIDDPDIVMSQSVGGQWWAEVTPLTGSELESARQVQSNVTHQIRMRHQAGLDIDARWRVVYNARDFEVLSVVTVQERFTELLILAREMTT